MSLRMFAILRNREVGRISEEECERLVEKEIAYAKLQGEVVRKLHLTGFTLMQMRPIIQAFWNPTADNRWYRRYIKSCLSKEAYDRVIQPKSRMASAWRTRQWEQEQEKAS